MRLTKSDNDDAQARQNKLFGFEWLNIAVGGDRSPYLAPGPFWCFRIAWAFGPFVLSLQELILITGGRNQNRAFTGEIEFGNHVNYAILTCGLPNAIDHIGSLLKGMFR